jgi:pimeloyl-ACP methyl ester carboxylesterase
MSDSKSGPARFDSIFPTQWSDCLNDFFVDVTLERLPGVADGGHILWLDQPEQCSRLTIDFLKHG